MSRIGDVFHEIRIHGGKGFIPFVTAGDPDVETSVAIILKLAELGADVIEIGVPFSDPMADGPTIQRSSQRALAKGVNVANVLSLAKQVREKQETPLVLFSYLNPLLSYGFENLSRDAATSGIDGILITDAIDEEAMEFSSILNDSGVDLISLVAPTTTDERLEKIVKRSSGFLYAVSRAGVTGATESISHEAAKLVERARRFTDLPIAVGFGISTRQQILDVWSFADAAVVGSAIVSEIEKSAAGDPVSATETFIRGLLPQFAKSGAEL
ncbi:MAG: tryptophan synthase subunit alpha [Pyrinomonadaceae bacterium]